MQNPSPGNSPASQVRQSDSDKIEKDSLFGSLSSPAVQHGSLGDLFSGIDMPTEFLAEWGVDGTQTTQNIPEAPAEISAQENEHEAPAEISTQESEQDLDPALFDPALLERLRLQSMASITFNNPQSDLASLQIPAGFPSMDNGNSFSAIPGTLNGLDAEWPGNQSYLMEPQTSYADPFASYPAAPYYTGLSAIHDPWQSYQNAVLPDDSLYIQPSLEQFSTTEPHLTFDIPNVTAGKRSSAYSRKDSTESRPATYSRNSSTDHSEKKFVQKFRQPNLSSSRGPVKFRNTEKPKVDDDRPWVRINTSTQGLTSRTAKINNFSVIYPERAHPLGDWTSSHGYAFKYTRNGEFADKTMSVNKIKYFIMDYPKQNGARLKLWIQKGPTDSARRYKSASWSKCRFRDCPAQIHQTGTILHGHYRVAFDEKWHRDRENADPFLCAGYVHLYCMERFLDFPSLCRNADVEADTRQLSKEPNGHYAASLQGQPECRIAEDFVHAAKSRQLPTLSEFANYPRHEDYRRGKPKPHEDTLTYHMTHTKAESRPEAQIRQFQSRGLKKTHLIVNKGDLEVLFGEIAKTKKAKRVRKRRAAQSDDETDDEQHNDPLIQKAYRQYSVKENKTAKSRTQKRQRRNHCDDSDSNKDQLAPLTVPDDLSDDDFDSRKQTHSSRRASARVAGKRVNYNEEALATSPGKQHARQTPLGLGLYPSDPSLSSIPGMPTFDAKHPISTDFTGSFPVPDLGESANFDDLFGDLQPLAAYNEGQSEFKEDFLARRRSTLTSSIRRDTASVPADVKLPKHHVSISPMTNTQTFNTEEPPFHIRRQSPRLRSQDSSRTVNLKYEL